MKLSEYIEKMIRLRDDYGDLELCYSADDEGNWYSQNVFSPEVGIYEDGEFRGTEPNEEPNSVCIN